MPHFDLPLDRLRAHRIDRDAPADLDAFWSRTLAEFGRAGFDPELVELDEHLFGAVSVKDVTFSGYGGDPIKAWLIAPRAPTGPLACRVEFIGYGGGRSSPLEHMLYPALGHAIFVMDTRGQGGTWSTGSTPDPAPMGGPAHPGQLTRGIESPETHYYTRLYVDAVRAVETAAALEEVDPGRIAVGGTSQGGGLALAAAALAPSSVRLCLAAVPFLSDILRASSLVDTAPYVELAAFLSVHVDELDRFARTLDYIDLAHLSARIRCRTIVSVGLMDTICPPSSVFAAYNSIESPKELLVSPFGDHAVPGGHHERFLKAFVEELAPS